MPMLCTRIRHATRSDWRIQFTLALCPPPVDLLSTPGRQYKYKIEDSPNYPGRSNKDLYLSRIIGLIRKISKEDIAIAGSNIRVWNLTNASYKRNPDAQPVIKLYAFKAHYEEFPITVPVTYSGDRLSSEALLVRINGDWKPMGAWLLEYVDRSYLSPNSSCEVNLALIWQQRWWNRNEKTFRLMELPAEIRANIFQHVLGSEIYPVSNEIWPTSDSSVCLAPNSRQFDSMYGLSRRPEARMSSPYTGFTGNTFDRMDPRHVAGPLAFGPTLPNYSILFVSKQVFSEAAKAVWEGTRKYFLEPSVFSNALEARPPTSYNWISRIELDFDIQQWFGFFAIST